MSVPAPIARVVRQATTSQAPSRGQRLVRGILAAIAAGYGAAMRVRNAAYDRDILRRRRLSCRILCVGNLTTGGTGKTPTVMLLVRRLRGLGERPVVLLRGYGRSGSAVAVVADGTRPLLPWREAGDEGRLLAEALPGTPVLIGADRVAAGMAAIRDFRPTILVLDDGFQHRRLHRDADLVLLDGTDPFGGGYLLPRGRLREPAAGLGRARAILVTRADRVTDRAGLRAQIVALAPGCAVGWAVHRPCGLRDLASGSHLPVGSLTDRAVYALSGIGNPAAFEDTLRGAGARVAGASTFADHHPFTRAECEAVAEAARRAGASCILTTAKDAIRLADQLPLLLPVLALEIEIEVVEGARAVGQALGVPLEEEEHG